MCRNEDEDELHGILKFKTKSNIKIKPKNGSMAAMYRSKSKPAPLTAEQQAVADQRLYHSLANSFRNEKEGGRLMTRRSMEDLLKKLTEEQRFKIAATHSMYGSVSYDRAADTIFKALKEEGIGPKDGDEVETMKGLALLMRHHEGQKHKNQPSQDERL